MVATHPYFPASSCLGLDLDRHPDLFDAFEIYALYARRIDFNRRAIAWAGAHGRPLVGNGDIHRLCQLGTTWSLVDAEPDPDAIYAAIKTGRVEVRSDPISVWRMLYLLAAVLPFGLPHTFGISRTSGVR